MTLIQKYIQFINEDKIDIWTKDEFESFFMDFCEKNNFTYHYFISNITDEDKKLQDSDNPNTRIIRLRKKISNYTSHPYNKKISSMNIIHDIKLPDFTFSKYESEINVIYKRLCHQFNNVGFIIGVESFNNLEFVFVINF